MKKVTPEIAAQIRERRASGETIAGIAKRYALSAGTVHGVVSQPSPAVAPPVAPASPPAPVTAPAGEPPSHDDLRRYLAEQVDALRADCTRYRADGNASALAAANRNLNAAAALLERVTPEPRRESEGVYVTKESMQKEADEGEAMLGKLAAALFSGSEHWPLCPACKQKVPPPEFQ